MAGKLDDRITFSVREVADALGVSDDSVRRWITNGELDAIRVGNRVLVLRQPLIDKILLAQGDPELKARAKVEAESVDFNNRRAEAVREGTYWESKFPTAEEKHAHEAEVERDRENARKAGFGEPIYA